ncbi:MAG TPA: hypothetical protein VIV40_26610 [Kofleriaceae bacterium]
MTTRSCLAVLVGCACWAPVAARADRRERAMQFEFGVNTRHFAADGSNVAFRTTTDPGTADTFDGGTAVTTTFRFTGKTRFNTFLGMEGEQGQLIGYSMSNIAGAYGVVGARGDLGVVRLSAELVAGKRWVRYDGHAETDLSVMIAEPRIRADLWLAPQFTIGAAAGATLSDRAVWMAGVYVGIHAFAFDR